MKPLIKFTIKLGGSIISGECTQEEFEKLLKALLKLEKEEASW